MNEINKKISAVFLATLMIASIFVAMVTPVAAAHEVTIDNVAPFYVQPGGIVNVEFTITPSHAMEDVDISIHRDNVTIGSFSNTFTDLTPNVPITRTANIEISDVAEEGTFHVAIESSGVNNPPCNDDPVVSESDALKHAIHVDGTAPHKVWGACPADDAIVEFPRTDQTITVTVEDNIQTNGEITLNYFREGFDEVPQQIVMAGMPGISTEYFATIDDTVVVDGNNVSYWITGTDAAGNNISEELGGTQADPLATYTVVRRTLSFVYITPGSVDDPVDVVMKNKVDFNFTAHDQFSNPYDEVEIDD
ncbi:MAG: hypothetical protein HF967_03415, partial [Methanosarcinales archaeon]|nr:hypothetical protein [Methanosarcinales archaeon]